MLEKAFSFYRDLRRNKTGFFGLLMVIIVIVVAMLAEVLAPYDPEQLYTRLLPPGGEHILGTDRLGRDVLSRLIFGSRASLLVASLAISIATLFGVSIGLYAGYYGGVIDNVLMRFVDVWLSFPPLFLAVIVVALMGPGLVNASIAIGVIAIPRFARIVRGSVLSVKEQLYIEAAKAIGRSPSGIILKHVLPNVSGPIIIQAVLVICGAILTEAAMSFLGLGVQPPTPSWGGMLSEARPYVQIAPWLALFPGVVIALTVFGFHLFGDGLRDMTAKR